MRKSRMFRLAVKNILSRPLRSLTTLLTIAVAAAMIFAMMSFRPAVYDFILSAETATSGDSDIRISTNSSSDRITQVTEPLRDIEGVEQLVPSLSLYALFGDEYVQLRGFETHSLAALQPINVLRGDYKDIDEGNVGGGVVISEAAAEHFGIDVGDAIDLRLGQRQRTYYVGAVAAEDGYFASDAPFKLVGVIDQFAPLIIGLQAPICNEIYVKVASGYDPSAVAKKISALPEYANLLVEVSEAEDSVRQKVSGVTAPVVLSGGAVLALSVAIIILLFLMTESEKISLISKLTVIGATRKQLFALFVIESALLALGGAAVGAGLAVGIHAALIRFTLSKTLPISISAGRLVGSLLIGFATAVLSSLLPVFRAIRRTIRQNVAAVEKGIAPAAICAALLAAVFVVLFAVELAAPIPTSAKAILGIAMMIVALPLLYVVAPLLLRLTGKALKKCTDPSLRVAGGELCTERRHFRAAGILAVGMAVSMLLFMSYSLTTSVFDSYVSHFENMVFVTNIRSDVDETQFEQLDGAKSAVKLLYGDGAISGENFERSVTMLGSAGALELVDFRYITPKQTVEALISGDKPYIFVDYAMSQLYGVQVGDVLSLTVGGVQKQVRVGGVLRHELFDGAYVVMSEKHVKEVFDLDPNTVIVTALGDVKRLAGDLASKYAENNYYVVDALTAFRWDMESTSSIFDLIGTLAYVVLLFVTGVTVAAVLVGRSGGEKARRALINAGMSKNGLLASEVWQHVVTAVIAFLLAFAMSVPMTYALISALPLFSLYFDFMYRAWTVATVGLVMAALYSLVPLAFNFKKGYTIKK